ncbi:MAG: L-threonylcarbamoyladenylate synthase, partial [Actinobacteria bacterium]|nr:L-threonylcarbamoyladenylate synthase [Actinomycetota bacterium]
MNTYITYTEATLALENGRVGVMPTDTVMGLTAVALDKPAAEQLYDIKHREQKPGTVLASSIDDLIRLGLDECDVHQAEQYWPNPISVVLPCINKELAYLHQGKQSLAVRIPQDERLRSLLASTGPLLTTSANMPGEPPARTTDEAKAYFADTVDFYVLQEEPIQSNA